MSRMIPLLALLLGSVAQAHDEPAGPAPMPLDQLMKAFGWSIEDTKISSQKLADGLHVLFGLGGNIMLSTGQQGTLLVDDQFPELVPKIRKAIAGLGGSKDVAFAINTHWHFDHAAGNLALGPGGTWLVSQSASRRMMARDNVINLVLAAGQQEAYPVQALPVITFDERMQFHFNGEDIELLHFGPAHTTGDAAVLFRKANAVHMGDVFNTRGYPFIDVDNGGSLDGVIQFCRQILGQINEQTIVVPGHGPVADHARLVAYVRMLETVRERIAKLLLKGASLDEVLAAGVTAEFDEANGDPRMLVDRAYASLSRAH